MVGGTEELASLISFVMRKGNAWIAHILFASKPCCFSLLSDDK